MRIIKIPLVYSKHIGLVIALILYLNSLGISKTCLKSEPEIKILFIGNSLTGYNKMPKIFKDLALASGLNPFVDDAIVYGAPLHLMVNNQMVINKINEKKWDYIVLQSDDITAFPDMYQIEINTVNAFKDLILTNNPSTKIIYTMIWGLRDGVTLQELNGEYVNYTYEAYINKIFDGTLFIADATQLMIAPVGWAWYSAILDEVENKEKLFSTDGAHPSLHGSYLMACVMNAVIFQNRDSTVESYSNIPAEMAIYYQQKAITTVFDNFDLWNLTPTSTWDNVVEIFQKDTKYFSVFPNPATTQITVNFELNSPEKVQLTVYSITGEVVDIFINEEAASGFYSKTIETNRLNAGTYICKLTIGQNHYAERLVIVR